MKKAIYLILLALSAACFITAFVLISKNVPEFKSISSGHMEWIGLGLLFVAIIYQRITKVYSKPIFRFSPEGTPPKRNRIKGMLLLATIFCSVPALAIGIAHSWDDISLKIALPLMSLAIVAFCIYFIMNTIDKRKYANK